MALKKCKECGHEVSKSADACPQCGAKLKKKTSLLTCGCLIILVIAAAIASQSRPNRKAGGGGNEPSSTTSHQVGERIVLGDFAYTVTGVTAQQTLGNSFMNETAGEGATFIVVRYAIENLGKDTATVMTDDFEVVDQHGRTFRPSSEANTALAATEDAKDMFLSELQPGLRKNMATAFEIPAASAQQGFRLVIPEKGLFGTKKAVIELSLP